MHRRLPRHRAPRRDVRQFAAGVAVAALAAVLFGLSATAASRHRG